MRQPGNGINFDTRPFRRSAGPVTSTQRDTVNLRRIRSRPQYVGISSGHRKSLNWMNHEIASWKKLSPNKRTKSHPCGSTLGTESATFFFRRFEFANTALLRVAVSGSGSNATFSSRNDEKERKKSLPKVNTLNNVGVKNDRHSTFLSKFISIVLKIFL